MKSVRSESLDASLLKAPIHPQFLYGGRSGGIFSRALLPATLAIVLAACSGQPATRGESGAITGALVGAGGGAIVGNEVGSAGGGAAIGAAAGGVAGAMVGHADDSAHADYVKQRQETLRTQENDIERQRREVEDLKRQQLHDESLRRYEAAN